MPTFRRSSSAAASVAVARVLSCFGFLIATGCSSFTDVPPPSSIVDPTVVNSQSGALTVRAGVLSQFADLFAAKYLGTSSYALNTGLFTDEYTCVDPTSCDASDSFYGYAALVDLRQTPVDESVLYQSMQKDRIQADQAVGLLKNYAPGLPSSYIGEMYAIKGYLYIMFGEFFCSGVPFGQLPYGGNISYGTGETTQQIFQDAVAQFDTALALSADSVRIQQLAMIGKGRALLNLGRFADAESAVSGVATTYRYDIQYSSASNNYLFIDQPPEQVGDGEGGNGLRFASSNDTRLTLNGAIPAKFATPSAPVTLADGIEARLIEAEAKLSASDVAGWAAALNDLRATAGITALTADSTTMASAALRQDVTFRERAFWMFGTGHRQGDLRRLIRQYGRTVMSVYPMGTSTTIPEPINKYSTLIVVDPPGQETQLNTKYKGCFNHDA